jgi:hypothetical protein
LVSGRRKESYRGLMFDEGVLQAMPSVRSEPKIVREGRAEQERVSTHLPFPELPAFIPVTFSLFFQVLDGDKKEPPQVDD